MKSLQKCMLPRNQVTPSSRLTNSPSSTPSYSVFQPVMATFLPSGRYVSDPLTFETYSNYTFPLPQAFWDATGGLWVQGSLAGKFAGIFVSTGTPGGGQESTVISSMSTIVHHGMIFVPLGYKNTFAHLSNLSEVRGGMFPPFASLIAGSLFCVCL